MSQQSGTMTAEEEAQLDQAELHGGAVLRHYLLRRLAGERITLAALAEVEAMQGGARRHGISASMIELVAALQLNSWITTTIKEGGDAALLLAAFPGYRDGPTSEQRGKGGAAEGETA